MNKITKYYFNLFLILSIGFFIVSCSPQQKKGIRDSTKGFVPSPQLIEEQSHETLAIGASAPDFTLPDLNGNMVSLSDFSKAKVLVVVFTCVHCPTATAYENRIIQFTKDYKDKGVQLVAIMSNSNLGLALEELGWSEFDDSYEYMKKRAGDKQFNFPFLYDGDDQHVALKYGPAATPHAFVFDQDRKLRYVGNIDQNENPEIGHGENLRTATDAVLAGKTVENPVTKTFGCSTKWSWKAKSVERMDKIWQAKLVELNEIDIAGIKNLMKNDSPKLRLINVWASWCGPCVIEYPELVKIERIYSTRNFEFISISADKISNKNNVFEFLKKNYSALPNYICSDDKYKLIEAVDPEWSGALPYSVLIDPRGKIVWKCQGEVDIPVLKKAIFFNPMLE